MEKLIDLDTTMTTLEAVVADLGPEHTAVCRYYYTNNEVVTPECIVGQVIYRTLGAEVLANVPADSLYENVVDDELIGDVGEYFNRYFTPEAIRALSVAQAIQDGSWFKSPREDRTWGKALEGAKAVSNG